MLKFKDLTSLLLNRSSSCAILMYHHIGDVRPDPWDTFVSHKNFKEQLEVIKSDYNVIPLLEYKKALSSGKKKQIIITFDDGYLDNYLEAVPELDRRAFPATFFIPTYILDNDDYFWWEVVDHLFWFTEGLTAEISLSCKGGRFSKILSSSALKRNLSIENKWSANTAPPPTERSQVYLKLCNWIKEKTAKEQQIITRQLLTLCQNKTIGTAQKMSPHHIVQLSEKGFEIGAHTIHHPALGLQPYEEQKKEINFSQSNLERLIGKKVSSIAYPHGHFNSETLSIIKESKYSLACATESGTVNKRSDWFTLPRFWVKDMNGSDFQRALTHLFKS